MIKVYVMTNVKTGQQYVGQTTKSLKERRASHGSSWNCRAVRQGIEDFGLSSFDIKLLAEASTRGEANILERKFIEKLNTQFPNGYNIRQGGYDGGSSEETRVLMSVAHKKLMSDPKVKAKRVSYLKKSYGCLKGTHRKNAKPIICTTNGKRYRCSTDAAKELNLDQSTVCAVARGKWKHTKGYSFVWEKI